MKKTNGFEKPNHTQTPNSFFDELLKEIDTMAELKFTLAIIRQTIGWHRKRVRYGVGKIERLTGMARNSVIAGAEAAELRGTVRRIETDGEAEWELVIEETPSDTDPSKFEGAAKDEGAPPQTLTENPSTVEGLKRKKERKEIIEAANKTVDFILETDRAPVMKYTNREKLEFSEDYLRYSDLYVSLCGKDQDGRWNQVPTKSFLHQWIMAFEEWKQLGLKPEHIRAAYEYATRPEGGFPVGHPGALTKTAIGMKSKGSVAPQVNRSAVDETKRRLEEQARMKFGPRPANVPPPRTGQTTLADATKGLVR